MDGWSGSVLWVCTALFALRVAGQLAAISLQPRWLPPHGEHWMSGLMPYGLLLPSQILILGVMLWISMDVSRGQGRFVNLRPGPAAFMMGVSVVYFSSMLVRYAIRMTRRPDQRWFGGTIPIVFHSVLATFLFVLGRLNAGPR